MIQAEIIEWKDPKVVKPTELGDPYPVVLREGNALEWTHTRPVMCEFGALVDKPVFTGFDHWACENVSVDDDVLWWAELPEIPEPIEVI